MGPVLRLCQALIINLSNPGMWRTGADQRVRSGALACHDVGVRRLVHRDGRPGGSAHVVIEGDFRLREILQIPAPLSVAAAGTPGRSGPS